MTLALKVNGTSFRAALRDKAANLKIGTQRRIVLFSMTAHQTLVATTPILTGKARAEWQIGLDAEPSAQLLPVTRPPTQVDYASYAQAAEAELDGYQSGQTIYIVNNSPYIRDLNSGTSKQAPANFIEAALAGALNVLRATL